MSNIIDLRTHFLLKEVRDSGDLKAAIAKSGMTDIEVGEALTDSPKFRKAILDCQAEFLEEKILASLQTAKVKAHDAHKEHIAQAVFNMEDRAKMDALLTQHFSKLEEAAAEAIKIAHSQ